MYSEFYDPIKKVKCSTAASFSADLVVYVVKPRLIALRCLRCPVLVVKGGLKPSKSLKSSLLKREAIQCHAAGKSWLKKWHEQCVC